MIALFLLLVIVAMVLGIVGVVAKGLLYLLFIGIAVFLGALLLGALRMRRRPGGPRHGNPPHRLPTAGGLAYERGASLAGLAAVWSRKRNERPAARGVRDGRRGPHCLDG
jgi:hypothetical protein